MEKVGTVIKMNTINYSKLSQSSGLVYSQKFKHAIGKLNQFDTFTKFKEDSEKRAEILPEDKDKVEGDAIKLQNFKQNKDTKDVGKGQKGFGEVDKIFEVSHLPSSESESESETESNPPPKKNKINEKDELMDSFLLE